MSSSVSGSGGKGPRRQSTELEKERVFLLAAVSLRGTRADGAAIVTPDMLPLLCASNGMEFRDGTGGGCLSDDVGELP